MSQPKSIYWMPKDNLKYPPLKKSGVSWLIYTQETLKIEAKEKKNILLNFGYSMSQGLILTYATDVIKNNLEIKTLIHGENKTDNIKIILFNFSNSPVIIPECSPFCFVNYIKS